MADENVLLLELEKLDVAGLKRLAQVWNIPKLGKDKKAIIHNLTEGMQDDLLLKGVLEKLSTTQVTIYTSILKSGDTILTLGEIGRKISMPPGNAEMELGVLKRYFLVYQRKNRERLTNNMDKYYFYPESGSLVQLHFNEKGEKFRQALDKQFATLDGVPAVWAKALGVKAETKWSNTLINTAKSDESIAAMVDSLSALERDLIQECFQNGGILEINTAREYLLANKGKWAEIVRKLHLLRLLIDDYYIDEKFIRLLILPVEIFEYLQKNPMLPPLKKGTLKRQERRVTNELDFFLNLQKLIVYISRKGLNLAKSGKIKQVDLKETEGRLLRPDISLFIEKSQIYQIELLLPVMRLLDIVRVKKDDVVLRNDYDAVLEMPPFELMKRVIDEVAEARNRRVRYEDVFEPLYIPFYNKQIFDECVQYIHRHERALHVVIMATMVREKLLLAKGFRIKEFGEKAAELSKEIQSALFFLQLFGLITVDYPDRWVELSDLGRFHLKGNNLERSDEAGGIIINPDLSVLAIPEKLSIEGLFTMKGFMEVTSFDNVYTFQLTRESFQEGLLLKKSMADFVDLLRRTSKNELSQNLLFSIEDWSRTLPLVTITDECVVVQTQDANHMDLLLGQISGKKIVIDQISPTTILIEADRIYETIGYAEKLNLIVRLMR